MIDNLQLILPLIEFDSEDDFYYLQILQRKKENDLLTSNSRVIKNYYIKSTEYLVNRYDEIKSLCDNLNARACLRLNRRSFRKTAFKALVNMSNTLSNQEFEFCQKSYDRAVGNGHNDHRKLWILDVDDKTYNPTSLLQFINEIEPDTGNKHIATIPSKSGYHIITTPFNVKKYKDAKFSFSDIEIHKDNPTNLYIP